MDAFEVFRIIRSWGIQAEDLPSSVQAELTLTARGFRLQLGERCFADIYAFRGQLHCHTFSGKRVILSTQFAAPDGYTLDGPIAPARQAEARTQFDAIISQLTANLYYAR